MTARYEARQHTVGRHTYWGVYDTENASWPAVLGGRRIPDMSQDRAEVERVAAELNAGRK